MIFWSQRENCELKNGHNLATFDGPESKTVSENHRALRAFSDGQGQNRTADTKIFSSTGDCPLVFTE
jgi:hypothetical protein